jgi:hypothetical protein
MSVVEPGRAPYALAYQFKPTDAGRAASDRPRQKNDCTVRALALARGIPYDEAYDILKAAGRKCSRGFAFPDWLNSQAWAVKMPFPAVKGRRRMNPATFTKAYPTGVFICRVAKHVFAVIDGVVLDTAENSPDRCIYTAWRIDNAG